MRMFRNVIKSLLGRALYPFLIPGAIERLKVLNARSMEEWIDCTLKFKYGFPIKGFYIQIRPIQVRSEIVGFLNLVQRHRPGVVCEIGTASGGTLFLFSKLAAADARLISIDLPWGKFGLGYLPAQIPLFRSFARDQQRIILLREDSHSPATLDKVMAHLNGEKIDCLFIDGDHSYEGAKKDFLMYSKLVKRGGIIAFHDIVPGPLELAGEVHRLWREIRDQYEHQEFVEDWNQGGAGVGVLYWNPVEQVGGDEGHDGGDKAADGRGD